MQLEAVEATQGRYVASSAKDPQPPDQRLRS